MLAARLSSAFSSPLPFPPPLPGVNTHAEPETCNQNEQSPLSTKRITDIATEYGDLGAAGNYTVNTSIAGEEKVPIIASSIRVLGGGELNFLTDTGQWFLFAQGTWKSVRPTQPDPKTLEDKG